MTCGAHKTTHVSWFDARVFFFFAFRRKPVAGVKAQSHRCLCLTLYTSELGGQMKAKHTVLGQGCMGRWELRNPQHFVISGYLAYFRRRLERCCLPSRFGKFVQQRHHPPFLSSILFLLCSTPSSWVRNPLLIFTWSLIGKQSCFLWLPWHHAAVWIAALQRREGRHHMARSSVSKKSCNTIWWGCSEVTKLLFLRPNCYSLIEIMVQKSSRKPSEWLSCRI